jgi:hypothetical protein
MRRLSERLAGITIHEIFFFNVSTIVSLSIALPQITLCAADTLGSTNPIGKVIEHQVILIQDGTAPGSFPRSLPGTTIPTWSISPKKMRAKSRMIDAQRKDHQKVTISSGVKVALGTDAGTFPLGLKRGRNQISHRLWPKLSFVLP